MFIDHPIENVEETADEIVDYYLECMTKLGVELGIFFVI